MDAIVQVIEDWIHASYKNDTNDAIFFDFAKAIDKTPPKMVNIMDRSKLTKNV